MRIADLLWRGVAAVLSRPSVTAWLVRRAQRTPYTHLTGDDGSVYMQRWWLFNPYPPQSDGGTRRWADWLPSVRVHHIRRRDLDRHLHDHPWNARTIILAGGYLEQRQDGSLRPMTPGKTAALRFGEYHRIDYVRPEGAVTLFITWRYRGTWGFLVDGRKVPWREYLAARRG